MTSSMSVVYQHVLESRVFAWPVRYSHMHRQIIKSHNLLTEIKTKLLGNNRYTNCFAKRYIVKNPNLHIDSLGHAEATTMSILKFICDMVIS
jgi:hypothetical protein